MARAEVHQSWTATARLTMQARQHRLKSMVADLLDQQLYRRMRESPAAAIDMEEAPRPIGKQVVRVEGGRMHPTILAAPPAARQLE